MLSQSSKQALARLRAYKPPPTQWHHLPLTRRAAVLILLFPDRYGELKVVLTMRAHTLRSYAGQAALPGGKAETLTETPFECARREAFEEIGLPLSSSSLPPGFVVEHLCELPTNLAKTELGVRPCVAFLHSTKNEDEAGSNVEEKMIPKLDPKEVAAVFTAPFYQFLRERWEGKEEMRERFYKGVWTDWHESRWRMHNFYIPKPPEKQSSMKERKDASPSPPSSSSSFPSPSSSSPSTLSPPSSSPCPSSSLPSRDAAIASAPPPPTTFRVFGMTARILVDAARVAYGEEPQFEHNSHHGDEDMIARLRKIGRLSEIRRKEEKELTREVLKEASLAKI
ncbi:NUDIX domain-containing protein [Delitschia confertaspora ATCC 74209]|uniref:NUDIX domain-containing protein n=1 Tax=Delitschia confertaspora ATCC 74209 TaxID=1513339 RepID=A0A9P4JRE5_9PLEO|nr:NUDIX domain-containing protein [Delitschia confertaspora ATCC 74209]